MCVCVLKGVALNEVYNTFQCSRQKVSACSSRLTELEGKKGGKNKLDEDDEVRQVVPELDHFFTGSVGRLPSQIQSVQECFSETEGTNQAQTEQARLAREQAVKTNKALITNRTESCSEAIISLL